MSLHNFTEKIELNALAGEVFQYFTDTEQIGRNFPYPFKAQIFNRTPRYFKQGFSLECGTRFLGIPIKWKLYVYSFSANRHISFLWQRSLFFISWEYNCYFETMANNQTRVTECVLYRLPLGIIGKFMNQIWVRPCLQRIFTRRRAALLATFQAHRAMETGSSSFKQENRSRPFKQNEQASYGRSRENPLAT